MWESEPIPDKDRLFMRVHKNFTRDGELIPGIFRDHEGAMSTDWEKYSTPEETRLRAKSPERNGVISMIAGEVRKIPRLSVQHSPDEQQSNRAHTDVLGEKDEEARVKLLRIVQWEIPVLL